MVQARLRWYALLVVLGFVGSIWIYATRVPVEATQTLPAAHVNFRAPPFSLTALDGSHLTLDDLRGRPVLVTFWATWCLPCREEMPALQAAFEAHRDQGLVVVAINAGEDDPAVTAFIRDFRLTFSILLDRDSQVLGQYQVQALPTSFFLDRAGIVRAASIGGMNRAYIEAQVALLEGAP